MLCKSLTFGYRLLMELTPSFRRWSRRLFGESSGVGRLRYCWHSFWSCKLCSVAYRLF